MKKLYILTSLFLISSCVPYKIAPNIEDYKIVKAKRFKRDLPNQYAFVFENDLEGDAFKHFAGNKFAVGHESLVSDVPFEVNGSTFYMSIHEREKTTETVNFLPLLIDGFLSSEGHDPILEESYATGNSYGYIVITVMDSEFKDCLAPNFVNRMDVILYLRLLKLEYQGSQNYAGAYLKK